ncbi:eukaryotic translation initiation factor 4e-like protein [Megavirus baoshan]|uniref:Eukaryotic translation initiation factor 4e-like protein n=1 Tax=Megavirus baoshan TaxID=2496520 RepID=A0A3Q8U835_9VIRU|nr:eukaryotic translation initiation factor 4e-like protein [Megavirus baoshan]AZL89467.1 eukaryotic translation initiation factor 4e-like protein [Megavirus baoshan]
MSNDSVITHNNDNIPKQISLVDIKLPNEWVLYLYDKQLFKKMANRANFQAKPHKALCTISTVNDLIYILKLMDCDNINKSKTTSEIEKKKNLDINDYIIMRKGIEPIWEDPKNSNGGTFTVKMNHNKGYEVWSLFVMYIMGETLTDYDMDNINGITVSYISDAYNFNASAPRQNISSFTYIKIWDAKPNRTRDEFINILPVEIINKIKQESIMYSQNNKKKDFNEQNIINKLNSNRGHGRGSRGGFSNYNKKNRREY